ncbi:hypothetical protein ACU8NH_03970 [Rhizobium leguminosarum]|uniref:hypothetical protein n=1 Tax=Rhizobium TaxID=379 RepID=UPI000367F0CC|nr:hypothetical protein [Rhizobium leguminosarum]MDH6659683.1 hypothetical protein [Rhizobium sophorae]ASS54076.1 hypothetical protein CHR56_05495 [Rhizobium leguminosarum bv. viciae]MBB4333110.1 hypothetical protein [Rhizobium leguminosarum]MBB4344532.1 hypothetical protein [Rhizobium leguminosarum]MBB4358825.1 hypothetical protein [Rhizobium leguminosarum]
MELETKLLAGFLHLKPSVLQGHKAMKQAMAVCTKQGHVFDRYRALTGSRERLLVVMSFERGVAHVFRDVRTGRFADVAGHAHTFPNSEKISSQAGFSFAQEVHTSLLSAFNKLLIFFACDWRNRIGNFPLDHDSRFQMVRSHAE